MPDTVTLKQYFDALRTADQTAVQAALVAQEKAIVKAEVAAEKRFDLLNELRVGVATKDQLEALEKVVLDLKGTVTSGEGASRGSQLSRTNFYTALTATVAVIGIIVTLIFAFRH